MKQFWARYPLDPREKTKKHRRILLILTCLGLFCAACCLGVLSLLYGSLYFVKARLFSYFQYPMLIFLNLLPAVLLASVTGAAAFLLTMLGKELSSAFSAGLHLLNLGLALFVLSILGAVHADRKRKEKFSRPETDSGEWQEAERVEGFPRE